MRIAIIAALSTEAKLISEVITSGEGSDKKSAQIAGLEIWQGQYAGHEITLCKSGMGTVNAAAATQLLITKYGAELVIFSGIAGNLNPNLKMGDIVIGQELHYIDTDTALLAESAPFKEVFWGESELIIMALRTAQNNVIAGIIASGDRFINDPINVAKIKESTNADCVDMESTAVAHICTKNDIKFLIIRAMSDNCDEDYDEFSNDFIDIERYASVAANYVLAICAEI